MACRVEARSGVDPARLRTAIAVLREGFCKMRDGLPSRSLAAIVAECPPTPLFTHCSGVTAFALRYAASEGWWAQ